MNEQPGRVVYAKAASINISAVQRDFARDNNGRASSIKRMIEEVISISKTRIMLRCFPPISLSVWINIPIESKKELISWRKEMIGECKKRVMKSVLIEVM